MAEEVKFTELKKYLSGLPENSPNNPYEITVVDYKEDSPQPLTKILITCKRFVDLSTTTLDGLSNLESGFYYDLPTKNCPCDYLVGAPNFTNCTAKSASGLFWNCRALKKVNIDGFTNIEKAGSMFKNCSALENIDTSVFTNLTNAFAMFSGCGSLTSIDTSAFTNVTNAKNMFSGCSLISIDTSVFTKVTNASKMFYGCSKLTNIGEGSFVNVEDASSMFYCCRGLTSIDTSVFKNVENASSMFCGCSGLTNIDTSAFKNVEDASFMFFGCRGLTSIDTSTFTNVTNAKKMFECCSGLTSIETGAFKNVINADGMFSFCKGLKHIDLTPFEDVEHFDDMFNKCDSLDEESKKAVEALKSQADEKNNRIPGNNIILQLKNNIVFKMSLGGKELFHSNMVAALLEDSLLSLSFFGLDENQYKVFTTFREKSNLDLIIAYCTGNDLATLEQALYNTGDSFDVTQEPQELEEVDFEELANKLRFIVVENKFKSIPYFEQLNVYNEKIQNGIGLGCKECNITLTPNNSTCFVLAPNPTLDSAKEDIEKAGWKTLSYENLRETVAQLSGKAGLKEVQKQIITGYCDMLKICLGFSEYAVKTSASPDNVAFVDDDFKRRLKKIRMHDMYEKLWFANALKLLPKAGQKNVTLCRSNYYRQNGLWEWKLNAPESVGLKNNLFFGIQIQERRFMISFEPEWNYLYQSSDDASRNEKIQKWISSILSELKNEYPNDLQEKKSNKDKLNQYKEFKYLYLGIQNKELTFAGLNAIIESAIDKINKSFESSDFVKDFNDSCFETVARKEN